MAWPNDGAKPVGVVEKWNFVTKFTSGTLSASPGPGVIGSLYINGGTMGAISITDNTAASGGNGTVLRIDTPSGNTFYPLNVMCNKGITLFASAATNITLTYI